MINAPEWISHIERTEYSDEIFSRIGRLLFKANRFESYCKVASSILFIKSDLKIMDDNDAFDKFIAESEKAWLDANVKKIKTALKFSEIKGFFTIAKNSRNNLAHALTLGIENIFGNTAREKEFEIEIKKLTKDIITGEYYAILLSCILTNELCPDKNYIQENIDWVMHS